MVHEAQEMGRWLGDPSNRREVPGFCRIVVIQLNKENRSC